MPIPSWESAKRPQEGRLASAREAPGKRGNGELILRTYGQRHLGLQVFVAASQASVDLQSAGPVGAGVDGDVCAIAGSANTATKLLRRAAEMNLRMLGVLLKHQMGH
jgi:hypothetical protein